MNTSDETINEIANATASINFSKLQRATSAKDIEAAKSQIEEQRLISEACFVGTDIDVFNMAYASELIRLSAAAAVVAEDAIVTSEQPIGISPADSGSQGKRRLDRLAVRRLVEREVEEMQACDMMGGNMFQLSLEQKDAVDAQIEHLSDNDKLAFLNVYTEEVNALTSQLKHKVVQINDVTSKINEQALTSNESAAMFGKIVGVCLLVGLAIFVFAKK